MMQSEPLVYITVLTFNGRRFLDDCLGALHRINYPNVRILLIDNGSTDDSVEFVREKFPEVEILHLDENGGIARAVNKGLRFALDRNADYICLTDDDTQVLSEDWLLHAIQHMELERSIGIMGFHEIHEKTAPEDRHPSFAEVERIDPCAMLFRSGTLKAIGLFDEGYILYGEDDDLEERTRKAGFSLASSSSPIFHVSGGTTKQASMRATFFQMASRIRFAFKHQNPIGITKRLARLIDVGCNPFPLTMDRNDWSHHRLRNSGCLLLNPFLLFVAFLWNVFQIPSIVSINRHERERIRKYRSSAAASEMPRIVRANSREEELSTVVNEKSRIG